MNHYPKKRKKNKSLESCKSDIIINNSNLSTQKSNNYKPERTFELESKFLKMKNQRIKRSFTIGSGIGHRWVPNELQNQSSFFLSVFLALWERGQWGHYYHYCYYWSGLWTVRWGHVDGEDLVLGKSGRRQNMIWFEEPKQIFDVRAQIMVSLGIPACSMLPLLSRTPDSNNTSRNV